MTDHKTYIICATAQRKHGRYNQFFEIPSQSGKMGNKTIIRPSTHYYKSEKVPPTHTKSLSSQPKPPNATSSSCELLLPRDSNLPHTLTPALQIYICVHCDNPRSPIIHTTFPMAHSLKYSSIDLLGYQAPITGFCVNVDSISQS